MSEPEQKNLSSNPDQKNPAIPQESLQLFGRFVSLQEKEAENKKLEFELREKINSTQIEFSRDSLTANERDRKDQRVHQREVVKTISKSIVGIIISILIFLGGCIYLNKDSVALEIIKYLGTALVSGIGGYGFGYNRAKQNSPKED